MNPKPHLGFPTLASQTFNWNSLCWTPTSEYPFLLSLVPQENTQLLSEPQTDTESSSL